MFIHNRTIQKELMVALILMALLPATIINLYYFKKTNSYIDNNIKSYNVEIIRQVGEKLDTLLDQTEITMRQLIATTVELDVSKYQVDMTIDKKIKLIKQTEATLRNIRRSFPEILDIYLLEFDGQVYSTNSDYNKERLLDQHWVRHIHSFNEGSINTITPVRKADYINVNDESAYIDVISFFRRVKGYGQSGSTKVIQLDINYNSIKKVAQNTTLGEEGFIFIVDSYDRVIYSPDPKYIGRKLDKVDYLGFDYDDTDGFIGAENRGRALFLTHNINNASWRIIGIIPTEHVFKELADVRNISIFIAIISIAFSFILSYILSKGITKPITEIIGSMKNVGEGEFNVEIPNVQNKDLQVLTHSFNKMVGQINTLMNNVVDKEKEKMNAELKALQTQINSHFLYNTLNSIKWMALMEKSYDIAHAIVALVQVLEFSSKSQKKIISIREEIDFINSYALIQKMRYGDCFEIVFDIEEHLYDYGILKFTLQPIIENAIIHGFTGKNDEGMVLVTGRIDKDRMVFQVEDNGVGMVINEKDKFSGLGIENVDTRIKLNFGDSYGLKMESNLGQGTRVTIDLPKLVVEEV